MKQGTGKQVFAAVAALIGGYLLYIGANPDSDFSKALVGFWLGLLLFIGIGWLLSRSYDPGRDTLSTDEIDVGEWRFFRFLRYSREAAPLYLGLRLLLAWEWLSAGVAKFQNPAWVQTGASLRAFWTRAVTVPTSGSAPITYPAYRSFIQFMLDNHWDTWFSRVIPSGEVLIGLGFLFGGLIGFAAFFALLMNFSFIFAGSTSSNPLLIILEVILLLGWRSAGWWGADRLLLARLGTPWSHASAGSAPRPVS